MPPVVRLLTFVDLDHGDAILSLSARHEAVLADGSRIVLLNDRGWTGSRRASVSEQEVVGTARMVVGPDEPFEGYTQADMEAGHWSTLADTLRAHGVEADADELRALPHDVEMSERVSALVRDARPT